MSLDKAEIKKLTLNSVVSQVEDLLEGAQQNKAQLEGGKLALFQAAKNLQKLSEFADRELEEEKIKDLETLTIVKQYITRAVASVSSLARQYENREISVSGEADFGNKVVKLLKKLFDEEAAKAERISVAQSEVLTVRDRPVGARPGLSIAQQRRQEEQDAEEGQLSPTKSKKTAKKKTPRKKGK